MLFRSLRLAKWSLAFAVVAHVVLLCRFHLLRSVPLADDRGSFESAAAPAEESAWPLYCSGLDRLDISREWFAILGASNNGPENAGWQEAKAWLEKHGPAIELFLEGSRKPRLGRFDPPSTAAWYETLQELNVNSIEHPDRLLAEICALLTGAGHSAAQDQNWSLAARCFAAPIGIVRQIWAEEGTPSWRQIDRLNEVKRAVQALEKLLAAHGAEIDQAGLAGALDALRAFYPDWRTAIAQSSRLRDRAVLTHLYSADGTFTGDGFLKLCQWSSGNPKARWFDAWFLARDPSETDLRTDIARQLLGPCLVPLVAGRDEMLRQADRLDELSGNDLAASEADGSESKTYDLELDRMIETWRSQLRYLPLMTMYTDSRVLKFYLAHEARSWRTRNVLLVVVAAELYQRRQGAWPDSLEALVPEYLDSVPTDEIGCRLRLCIINGRPVVYSVGYDNVDDTAAIPSEKRDAVDPRDIRYFPPVESRGRQ